MKLYNFSKGLLLTGILLFVTKPFFATPTEPLVNDEMVLVAPAENVDATVAPAAPLTVPAKTPKGPKAACHLECEAINAQLNAIILEAVKAAEALRASKSAVVKKHHKKARDLVISGGVLTGAGALGLLTLGIILLPGPGKNYSSDDQKRVRMAKLVPFLVNKMFIDGDVALSAAAKRLRYQEAKEDCVFAGLIGTGVALLGLTSGVPTLAVGLSRMLAKPFKFKPACGCHQLTGAGKLKTALNARRCQARLVVNKSSDCTASLGGFGKLVAQMDRSGETPKVKVSLVA